MTLWRTSSRPPTPWPDTLVGYKRLEESESDYTNDGQLSKSTKKLCSDSDDDFLGPEMEKEELNLKPTFWEMKYDRGFGHGKLLPSHIKK